MKDLDAPTLAHLASEELTLATCWKIQAEGQAVVGFTDHDQPLTVSGVDFSSLAGYTPTEIQSTSTLSVDNLDIEGLLSELGITDADIQAGYYDRAEVWMFQVNWEDASIIVPVKYGHLGEIHTSYSFLSEFRSLSQLASQTIGETITPDCRAALGDAECGIALPQSASIGDGLPHQFWRIYTTANGGDTFTACYNFEMALTVGGADQVSGGSPVFSSQYDSGTSAATNAFDGDPLTGWNTVASEMPNYIGYDFGVGNGVAIQEFRLICIGVGKSVNRGPKDFLAQYSDNGIDWVTALTVTGETWVEQVENTFVVGSGFDYAGFTSAGSVVSVIDRSTFTDTTMIEADNYFKYGLLTWTSGFNNGYSMEVKGYTLSSGEFVLFEPMPFAVEIGDTYSVYAGCDKFAATCKAKFSNLLNFRGYPNCPTQDQISKFGGQ